MCQSTSFLVYLTSSKGKARYKRLVAGASQFASCLFTAIKLFVALPFIYINLVVSIIKKMF